MNDDRKLDENIETKDGEQKDGNEGGSGTSGEGTVDSLEELKKQLAQERANATKLKSAFDKTTSELSKLKKSMQERMTQSEIDEQKKQEEAEKQAAYISELERYKKKSEAVKRYRLCSMTEEDADAAAEAEINGDYDTLAAINRRTTARITKEARDQWLKERPEINAGGSDDGMSADEKTINSIFGFE